MPNSNTIAVGATSNNGLSSGDSYVRIFSWNGSDWIRKGNDIVGKLNDISGEAISMPDSNTIAIGADKFYYSGKIWAGLVRLYKWDGNSWKQEGNDIVGENDRDQLGCGVYMPNPNTLAVGVYYYDGNGFDAAGLVQIYSFCNDSESLIDTVICEKFTSPSGRIWTTSGIYMDTILNYMGCDSIITIDLTVKNSSTSRISETVCNSYISPNGKIWTTSGIYTDTIPNTVGCDSVITIDLTIACNNSISENSILPVSIYPIPSNDLVYIELDKICDNLTFEVFNLKGLLVSKKKYNNIKYFTYNLESPPGIYILKLYDNKGNLHVFKLIKQ
jgi:hypothetical protein